MLEQINSILNISIFQNLVSHILIAIFLIALYPFISKVISFVVTNILSKWAEKTKTNLDDIIINSLIPPINLFVLVGLFYVGLYQLNWGSFQTFIDTIFNLLLIIPIVYFMIKLTTKMITYYLKGKGRKVIFNEAAIDILMQVVQVALVIIGILVILSNIGYNVSALLTGLGIGGLAFALASQDLLRNFFSGISLIFDKAFSKGERVKFDVYEGFIEEVRLRSTKMRTFDGTLLTIPNSMLSNDVVENVSRVPKFKISMVIGVEYSTSSKKLKEGRKIIYDIIKNHPDADENSAWVYFDNFSAYSLDIQVIYYAKELTMSDWPRRVEFKEEINFEIKERFEEAGIVMAFPTQTLEIKNTNPQERKK